MQEIDPGVRREILRYGVDNIYDAPLPEVIYSKRVTDLMKEVEEGDDSDENISELEKKSRVVKI